MKKKIAKSVKREAELLALANEAGEAAEDALRRKRVAEDAHAVFKRARKAWKVARHAWRKARKVARKAQKAYEKAAPKLAKAAKRARPAMSKDD